MQEHAKTTGEKTEAAYEQVAEDEEREAEAWEWARPSLGMSAMHLR